MRIGDTTYREVWGVDFEYSAPPGERPTPICMVARELDSGRTLRVWCNDLRTMRQAPFDVGPDSLFIAYYASAELGCFSVLDWAYPVNVLDLFTEFRNLTNGLPTTCGAGLLGALTHFGIDGIDTAEKTTMRDLALRGGPYTDSERCDLLAYCETDVVALGKLLPAMRAGLLFFVRGPSGIKPIPLIR